MKKQASNSGLLSRWKNREKKEANTALISKAPEGALIPLSQSQKRLWFLQSLYPKSHFYNYAEHYEFEGELDTEKLLEALKLACDLHDILSSTYHMKDGAVFLKKTAGTTIQITQHDLSELDVDKKASASNEILKAEAQHLFDLTKQPVVLVSLIKMHETKYLLLLTLHHISTDKWSMGLLRKQWAENYQLLRSNVTVVHKPLTIQYADFAFWQQSQKINQKQLDYWKIKLSGEIPFINLPTDFNKPAVPTFKGAASKAQYFSAEQSTKILTLAKELAVTPYVLFLSVYYVLLFRYSGQKDILIGSPLANRDQKALENLVGFFNDTVVLRTALSADKTFEALAQSVKKTTLEAFSNKDIPFNTLVKELKQERSLSINPFFQVMFLYHSVPENPSFGAEVQLKHSAFDMEVSKFDLTLYISEENGILSSTFEYSTDLFTAASISRFQQHFKLLMHGVVENKNRGISDLPMLTENENQFFLKQNTQTESPFKGFNGIHEVIEDIVKKHPDAIAVSFMDATITYSELNQKATALAHKICSKTQNQNQIVGLCIDRSIAMIVGLLGILKAGCAYLPIDPKYPKKRIEFVLEDAEVAIVVTESNLTSLFDTLQNELIAIDDASDLESYNSALPAVKVDDLAYMIYTSGSTGNPKGVPITHQNILNSTGGRLQFYDTNPAAFLLMSSISFDSSKAGIFWTLCTGGNLVVTENRIEQDISKIAAVIYQNNVTHTLMLPSLYSLVLEHAATAKIKSLTTVIVAGEACSVALCASHFDTLNTVGLYNEYGPTEATVWCIAHKVEKNDLAKSSVPIGKPVANAKVYILDELLNTVAFGAVGEIYIGGLGLSGKYFKRQDMTNEAYVSNPFKDSKGEKLYKTGDLGKYAVDGTITFLGRSDQQIKIRGYRVELGEIEKAIVAQERVSKAIVIAEKLGASSSKRLSAYVISEENLDINNLKAALKKRLPDYMVPTSIAVLAMFPTLPNGKVDKKALVHMPKHEQTEVTSNVSLPTTVMQEQLLGLWKEVLQIDKITIYDNFFELGGDSILSIQIIAKARKIGFDFSPNDLFEHQTIAGLETQIAKTKENTFKGNEAFSGAVALSPVQKWFFETHKTAPHFWNQAFSINGHGLIKKERVKRAAQTILDQHEALRSVFEKKEGSWAAKVLSAEKVNSFFDFQIVQDGGSTTKEKMKIKLAEIQSELDLAEGPLFKCLYFDLGADIAPEIILLAHHLVVDVVSWDLILNDFVSYLSSEEKPEITKTTSILTWSNYLEELASSKELAEELVFWNAQIAPLKPLQSDFAEPLPIVEKNVKTLAYTLDQENTKLLTSEANTSYNTKTDELLLAAITNTMASSLGVHTISFALERHGRETLNTSMDLSNTIGWFTSFFPIIMTSLGIDEYENDIIAVKERMRKIPNGGIGYGVLRYLTDKLGDVDYPQVVFNFLGTKTKGEFEFLQEGIRHPLSERNYLIEINAHIENGVLVTNWSYSSTHYLEKTISDLLLKFDKTLKGIIDHCSSAEEGKFTPSDFPELDLGQEGLDDLFDSLDL